MIGVREAPVCPASLSPRQPGCPQFGNGLLLETPGDVVGDSLGLLCPQPDLGTEDRICWSTLILGSGSSPLALVGVPTASWAHSLKIAPSLKGLFSCCSSKPQGFPPPEGVGLP